MEAAAGARATQPQFSGKGSGGGSSVRRFGEDRDGRGAERPASGLGRALQATEVRLYTFFEHTLDTLQNDNRSVNAGLGPVVHSGVLYYLSPTAWY